MECGNRVLVLAAHAQALVLGGIGARSKLAYALGPGGELGVDLGPGRPGPQQLAAVVADVGDRPDRDDLPRGGRAAPADAADDAIALGDLDQQGARGLGHVRVGGMPHDRRQGAVDVKEHRCAGGFGAERLERLHERGSGGHEHKYGAPWPPPLVQVAAEHSPRRSLRLMAIGTLAGLFSGLFGVGGGSVIVPLLILWLGYDERAATATSLAAIVFIAGFAAAAQGLYGNVQLLDALLVGGPRRVRRADRSPAAAATADALDRAAVRRPARGERRRAGAQMIGAIAIGIAGGIVAGLLGVGGGVLFVPGLVLFLGLDHQAEATSLLAIVPVAIVGTYRNDRYGNVRRADALLLGVLSVAGAAAGVALANALSGAFLRDAFAVLMLVIAAQLVHRATHERDAAKKA